MTNTKIKGLNTPKWIVGIKGFWDAKVRKTAVIDPHSGQIVSGYLTWNAAQLHAYEAKTVKLLGNEVKAVRADACKLMTEYSQVQRNLKPLPPVPDPDDVFRMRQYVEAEKEHLAAVARLNAIESRLMEITTKLRDREHHVIQDLRNVMGLMRSKFAAYGHGMLLRPVSDQMLPELKLSGALDDYHKTHAQEDACIQRILQEVYHV